MSTLRLASDRIAGIEVKETVSRGGIVIPDTHIDKERARTLRIKVTAVGPGALHVGAAPDLEGRIPLVRVTPSDFLGFDVQPGDVIVCTRYVQKFEHDGVELKLLKFEDVTGKIDPDAPPENIG